MASLEIKSLFDDEVYREFIERIHKIAPDDTPEWGKMSPAQMFAHCAEIQEVCNGTKELGNTPFQLRLMRPLIKWFVVNKIPYSKGMPTHPQYEQNDSKNFDEEKKRFIQAIDKFRAAEDKANPPHPFLGKMTAKERGWGMYKHHNHHLQQFEFDA